MIPLTIPLIQTIGITILQAKNMHRFRSVVYFIIAIVNIFASLELGKMIDGLGCALATCISMTIGHILIMNIYYYKKVKLDMIQFWKEIIKLSNPIIFALITGVMIKIIINEFGILNLVISIVLFSFSYLILMWNLGLNNYEKNLLRVPFKLIYIKVFKKLNLIKE